MATTILRAPALRLSSPPVQTPAHEGSRFFLPFERRHARPLSLQLSLNPFALRPRMRRFAATESEAAKAEEVEETVVQETSNEEIPVEDDAAEGSSIDDKEAEEVASPLLVSLQAYREALQNGDQAKIEETEAFLKSIENERDSLRVKVAALSAELSIERDRILRISADFDNFRKRTERERLSLMSNAQGEVVESLLPVLDNFERAKDQIKIETEGEEKINNSYQSIYKQFLEILKSLGVEAVETVGKQFDPLLHEAIMREESTEFDEDVIIQEFRKGFKLGDRLLRPAMVKVSAGPGPKKSEPEEAPTVVESSVTSEESNEDEVDSV